MTYFNDTELAVLKGVLRNLPDASWVDFREVSGVESLTSALVAYTVRLKVERAVSAEKAEKDSVPLDEALADKMVRENPGKFISAIKAYRLAKGVRDDGTMVVGLKDAKDAIDAAWVRVYGKPYSVS